MTEISMRHVTHVNESCHTHEWVIYHMWMTPQIVSPKTKIQISRYSLLLTHIYWHYHTFTDTNAPQGTAYCIWSVISSFSNLNRRSSSLGLFCHVPLKRDRRDWDWRLSLNDAANAIGCTVRCRVAKTHRIPYLYRSFPAKVTYI